MSEEPRLVRVLAAHAWMDSPAKAQGIKVSARALDHDPAWIVVDLEMDESVVGWSLKVNGMDWPPTADSQEDRV